MCIVLCALAALVLFFPFTFWVHGELNVRGAKAWGFFYKKKIFEVEKVFGEDSSEDADVNVPSESFLNVESTGSKDKGDPSSEVFRAEADAATASDFKEDGKESSTKQSLTETEFWTILLTPEFDARAWWAVKKLLLGICRLCRLKFINCFVEGIRTDYARMGELASLNAFLKSYPYIGAWDFRMDWTYDHELRGEGHARIRVNLCRLIGLVLVILFYGGIVLWNFWRRRARVLKTGELPELGWIRTKIVKMMAEE